MAKAISIGKDENMHIGSTVCDILLVLAIEFVAFAIEFVHLAIEFVPWAIEFVALA